MFVVHRMLLMVSQGGDEEVYLLPGEKKAANSGFALVGEGEREGGQEGERKLRKQLLNESY